MEKSAQEIQAGLSAVFDERDIKARPGATSGNKAMVLFYIDARAVQERLDAVVGCENWQDSYQVLPDHSVLCKLSIRINGEWISKEDAGKVSAQPDGGDRNKSAFSDALKRAAIKWGIGRFLYRVVAPWAEINDKKRFVNTPRFPGATRQSSAPQQKPVAPRQEAPPTTPAPPVAEEKPRSNGKAPPKDGVELMTRLLPFEQDCVRRGRCKAGEVINEVEREVKKKNADPEAPATWSADLVKQLYSLATEYGKPVGGVAQ